VNYLEKRQPDRVAFFLVLPAFREEPEESSNQSLDSQRARHSKVKLKFTADRLSARYLYAEFYPSNDK